MSEQPVPPIVSGDLAWSEWAGVPRFAVRYRHLTRAAVGGDYRVGVVVEELAPGRQSAPVHYHLLEEEHVYVLEGALTVRLGAERFAMGAGDYVCFPAGQKAGHCLLNEGEAPCRYVLIGERNPNDVVIYPESNKMLVRALGREAIYDLAARLGYWDGEATGLPAGESPPAEPAPAEPAPAEGEPPARPRPPIAAADVALEATSEGTRFGGTARHLTYAAVGRGYHVGVLIEAPAPGRQLAPRHYHMGEEEHALILEGEATLLLGEERHLMRPGDYACFPAGRKVAHAFLNAGPGPCRYLMIGERNRNDVIVYPDSNKMMVGPLLAEDDIFDMSGTRRYWDGEATT